MNQRRRFKAKRRRAKAQRVRLYIDRYVKTLRFHPDAFGITMAPLLVDPVYKLARRMTDREILDEYLQAMGLNATEVDLPRYNLMLHDVRFGRRDWQP